jgi:hypothetical protein
VDARPLRRTREGRVVVDLVEAEPAELFEDVPQHRAARDHVGWVGEAIEMTASRTHHVRRKLVDRVAYRSLFLAEVGVDVRQCHDLPSTKTDASGMYCMFTRKMTPASRNF